VPNERIIQIYVEINVPTLYTAGKGMSFYFSGICKKKKKMKKFDYFTLNKPNYIDDIHLVFVI